MYFRFDNVKMILKIPNFFTLHECFRSPARLFGRAGERKILCSSRILSYSIPSFSILSGEPKSLAVSSGLIIQRFPKKVLDNQGKKWYDIQACAGILRVQCDDAVDCAPPGGNFRGVCPVIGRLNCFEALAYIAGAWKKGRPRSAIFHGSE